MIRAMFVNLTYVTGSDAGQADPYRSGRYRTAPVRPRKNLPILGRSASEIAVRHSESRRG